MKKPFSITYSWSPVTHDPIRKLASVTGPRLLDVELNGDARMGWTFPLIHSYCYRTHVQYKGPRASTFGTHITHATTIENKLDMVTDISVSTSSRHRDGSGAANHDD